MIDAMSDASMAAWLRPPRAALHRSIPRNRRVSASVDTLPDAVRRDLGIERSPMRRLADQEARLRADALFAT